MDYLKFNAGDFAAEESFQNYHFRKEEKDVAFWKEWIASHPSKQEDVEAAQKLLSLLNPGIIASEKHSAFQELQGKIHRQSKARPQVLRLKGLSLKWAAGIAAAVLIGLSFTFFQLWEPEPPMVAVQTDFGQIKEIYLPDSSRVWLNSNSEIKYVQRWNEKSVREIWLEGEAFFEVRKNPVQGSNHFEIHTNKSSVEVLGTSFNVYNRQHKVAVVLETGEVKFQVHKPGGTEDFRMVPNDRIQLDEALNVRRESGVVPNLHSAWKDRKLQLDNTPLSEVVAILKDNYGLEMIVENDSMLDKKLTTLLPIMDIELLLISLREIHDFKVRREGNKIWVNE